MRYKVKSPAFLGDIVQLQDVAEAMAKWHASACGTDFHEPAFNGMLTNYILDLLEEVRWGRLKVCNQVGAPLTVDKNIEATRHFGYWDREKTKPRIFWLAKLKMLNEWAKKRGNYFHVCHDGIAWVDERGSVVPPIKRNVQKLKKPDRAKKKEKSPIPDISMIQPDKWYETSQVARLLGYTQKYVQNILIPQGKLKARQKQIGSRWEVHGQTLRDYRMGRDNQ